MVVSVEVGGEGRGERGEGEGGRGGIEGGGKARGEETRRWVMVGLLWLLWSGLGWFGLDTRALCSAQLVATAQTVYTHTHIHTLSLSDWTAAEVQLE